ncbi:MAG: DUF1569 domain-containing protein [Planctomycetes bacterium]|nr:DUF1569 domain-containing protein [Planctomycetota bacterium]
METTIFEPGGRDAILKRIQSLTNKSTPAWGKMNVSQMMAHCAAAMRVPTGDLILKKTWLRIIGSMVKKSMLSDKPWKPNMPTAPEFKITNTGPFDEEHATMLAVFNKLARGREAVKVYDHPFFGKMTFEEWGRLHYKHLDHHLRQFGV